MTIRFDDITHDAQGLPVVSWVEDRNIFAPDGLGPARVACFVRPDEKTRELMFVAAGSVRHGAFEEARRWATLHTFEIGSADHHYWSAQERVALDVLTAKSRVGKIILTDGAQVLLGNFRDERATMPMHINCASARPVEVDELHDRLRREFIDKRDEYLRKRCNNEIVWKGRKEFEPFSLPKPVKLPPWADWLANALVAGILGLMGFGFYWFVMR